MTEEIVSRICRFMRVGTAALPEGGVDIKN